MIDVFLIIAKLIKEAMSLVLTLLKILSMLVALWGYLVNFFVEIVMLTNNFVVNSTIKIIFILD